MQFHRDAFEVKHRCSFAQVIAKSQRAYCEINQNHRDGHQKRIKIIKRILSIAFLIKVSQSSPKASSAWVSCWILFSFLQLCYVPSMEQLSRRRRLSDLKERRVKQTKFNRRALRTEQDFDSRLCAVGEKHRTHRQHSLRLKMLKPFVAAIPFLIIGQSSFGGFWNRMWWMKAGEETKGSVFISQNGLKNDRDYGNQKMLVIIKTWNSKKKCV